jgi:hypothetical protein
MHTVFTVCFEECPPDSGFLFITNKTTTAGHQIVIFTCHFCISNYFETNLNFTLRLVLLLLAQTVP